MARLHSKGRKHNKRRNVGLVYEFIVRHIIDSVLKEDNKSTTAAVDIIKRRFHPGTELYREWRLFNAVIKTQGVDETMANAIIRETRDAVRRYDRIKLDREKSQLIHEVNHNLGQDVYGRGVPDYTTYATVQTLFNDWRETGVPNISRIADYERKLQLRLMAPKPIVEATPQPSSNPGQDALVIKLMAESLNKRYAKKLNPLQRSILSMFAFEGSSLKLSESLDKLKGVTLQLLDDYSGKLDEVNDKFTRDKLTEARVAIDALNPQDMDGPTVARFLKLCELKEEFE